MKKITLLIALLFLASCISISTTDTISIEPANEIANSSPLQKYDNFASASQNLHPEYISTVEQEQNYLNAIGYLKIAETKKAEESLTLIVQDCTDTSLVSNAEDILSNLSVYLGKWNDVKTGESNLLMAKAYGSVKPEKWTYPDKSSTLPIKKSVSGTPVVEVKVNGKKYNFWIDTGASLSVLRSDIAEDCGISPINSKEIGIGTATKDITFAPGIIDQFKIGDITIENHPVIILNKSQLTFKIFKIFTILKIDGIIGENAIKNMHLKMDFANNLITISKPEKLENSNKNLFWINEPIVQLKTTDGQPVNFFFDSGANNTSLYSNFLRKQKLENGKNKHTVKMGAGGKEFNKNTEYENVALYLENYKLNFAKIGCENTEYEDNEIYYRDGVLGCDFFQDKVIEIDYTNGRLTINENK